MANTVFGPPVLSFDQKNNDYKMQVIVMHTHNVFTSNPHYDIISKHFDNTRRGTP